MTATPRAALRRACTALAAWGLAASAVSAGDLAQLSPGPYPTASWDWDFGQVETTHPTSGNPLFVDHYGRLVYPSDGSDGGLPPLHSDGNFPLVVFGHGRFHTGPTLFSNHLEAGYLMERLASWGIVATTVNLDVVGSFSSPAAIPQRGDIMLETFTDTLAGPAGGPPGLVAAIDASRLGILGHSRGGEGAVAAVVKNALETSPLPILAIGTIAPTDFQSYTLPDVPYMGLYGSKDGDVNNGWPIFLHDRATSSTKVHEHIQGANHFFFTENITCSCEGDADLPRALHHDIAAGYFTGFMVRQLDAGGPLTASVFADGPEMAPLTSQAEILPMYRDPVRLVLDDFESNFQPELSSSGTPILTGDLVYAQEHSFNATSETFYHLTRGFVGIWNGPPGFWAVGTPGGDFDATQYGFLSFKFAQREVSAFNTEGQAQNVSVAMRDTSGTLAVVNLADHGTIPWPPTHTGGGPFTSFPIKSVLRTTRIPISAFTQAQPALDPTHIDFVGWWANVSGNQGEIEVDDVEFTQ